MSSNLHYLPLTVGDTLQSTTNADADAVVIVFRERESSAWRVGWSAMELSTLLLAREYLDHCIKEIVAESYVEGHQ